MVGLDGYTSTNTDFGNGIWMLWCGCSSCWVISSELLGREVWSEVLDDVFFHGDYDDIYRLRFKGNTFAFYDIFVNGDSYEHASERESDRSSPVYSI